MQISRKSESSIHRDGLLFSKLILRDARCLLTSRHLVMHVMPRLGRWKRKYARSPYAKLVKKVKRSFAVCRRNRKTVGRKMKRIF